MQSGCDGVARTDLQVRLHENDAVRVHLLRYRQHPLPRQLLVTGDGIRLAHRHLRRRERMATGPLSLTPAEEVTACALFGRRLSEVVEGKEPLPGHVEPVVHGLAVEIAGDLHLAGEAEDRPRRASSAVSSSRPSASRRPSRASTGAAGCAERGGTPARPAEADAEPAAGEVLQGSSPPGGRPPRSSCRTSRGAVGTGRPPASTRLGSWVRTSVVSFLRTGPCLRQERHSAADRPRALSTVTVGTRASRDAGG